MLPKLNDAVHRFAMLGFVALTGHGEPGVKISGGVHVHPAVDVVRACFQRGR